MKWFFGICCCILSLNAASGSLPKIAIIIDDIGYNFSQGKQIADLGLPLTLAILPDFNQSKKIAEYSNNLGIEVILHLPMESTTGNSMGQIGMSKGMTDVEKLEILDLALSEVPHAVGVNNHMGSLLTQDESTMRWLMGELSTRNLFFVDSLTIPGSVAASTAKNQGLYWAQRQVFLDNTQDTQNLDARFQEVIRIARQHGQAILIAHPHQETLDYIKLRLPLATDIEQVQFVPVSQLLNKPSVATALR